MNRRLFQPLCLALGLLLSAAAVQSAPILVETLDWAIADADLVVRGTLADFDRVRDKNELIWSTATVKVADTYKGGKQDEVKIIAAHKSRFASDKLSELAKEKKEVLLCLVKSERYKARGADYTTQPWALRVSEGEIDHAAVDLSGDSGAFAIVLDGRVLARKDDILKAAAAAGKEAKTPTQGRVRAPSSAEVVKKLSDGGPAWLLTPLDGRLEEAAKDWLKSKELDFRLEGAKTLRHFKSDANTELLKGLLTDAQSQSDGKTKTFPVRKAAYDVLKEWKVEVQPPVLEEADGQ
ncbi:MAG: hypothetical protein JNM56_12075 [Planctomycetia bacterium]|nr:hypothetical protein [Planctomycetia bacterium]